MYQTTESLKIEGEQGKTFSKPHEFSVRNLY